MPSPFPGMDPYLEISGDWRDFHARFINVCCDAVNDRLPDNYIARMDERFRLLELPDERARTGYPDVAVLQTRPSAERAMPAAGAMTLEPVSLRLATQLPEEMRETYIEIRRERDWKLVTSVELLSPTNKVELGYTDHLAKRMSPIHQPVNLVELDLLIVGHRLPMSEPLPPGDYYAMVSRADQRPRCDVYAWSVRRALPTIPIPLSAPDPDIEIDLAGIFATTYQRGRYHRSIRYDAPLNLPLNPEDCAWAEQVARPPGR